MYAYNRPTIDTFFVFTTWTCLPSKQSTTHMSLKKERGGFCRSPQLDVKQAAATPRAPLVPAQQCLSQTGFIFAHRQQPTPNFGGHALTNFGWHKQMNHKDRTVTPQHRPHHARPTGHQGDMWGLESSSLGTLWYDVCRSSLALLSPGAPPTKSVYTACTRGLSRGPRGTRPSRKTRDT